MKNTKLFNVYLSIQFLLLLVLFCQKYSSCQNALNNSKTNYGLNDEELRAMLLGINYNPNNINQNNILKRESAENEFLLLGNLINEDTLEDKKNEKIVNEIENMQNIKKEHSDISNINTFNKNTSLIKDEKNNENFSLENVQSLPKTSEDDKLNKENNPHGNVDEHKNSSGVLGNAYDLNNADVYINKNNDLNESHNSSEFSEIEKNEARNIGILNKNADENKEKMVNDAKEVIDAKKENNEKELNAVNASLLHNESGNVNNDLEKKSDNISKISDPLLNDLNTKNDKEYSKMKKLENEEVSSKITKNLKENTDEIKPEKSKYILNSNSKGKDNLKQENTDNYLEESDHLNNNTLPKRKNFYKMGKPDEKTELIFKKEDQIKYGHFPEQVNIEMVSGNDEKNKLNKQINYNHKIENLTNNEEKYNTKFLSPKNVTNFEEKNDIKYSVNNENNQHSDDKKHILKKIKPVKLKDIKYNKLDDTSEEGTNETLNNTEQNGGGDAFSEKIRLKKSVNDRNEYKYLKLKNNELKVLGIINKYSPKGGFSITVDCGGYDDFDGISGIAHLLQHSIFYRSKKRSTTLLSELGKYSSEYNCSTNESFTNYYAIANSEDIYHLLKLFVDNIFYPVFDDEYITNEVKEINNEYFSMENNPENCLKIISEYNTNFKYSKSFVYGNYITLCQNAIRNRLNVKKSLYEFHKKCYQPKNMSLAILLGKKVSSDDQYNINDIENMVIDIFEKLKNFNYSKKNEIKKEGRYLELKKINSIRRKNKYNTNFIDDYSQNNFMGYNNDTKNSSMFIEFINKSNYMIDLNQKSKYIEILKKKGWEDTIYLYWSSKINIDLYKKIEEFGSMNFLQEVFFGYKQDGLYYKLSVENKYAYDLKNISTYNKNYFNFGILIKLTKDGKKKLAHLHHICNVFIKEITKLFDHDSLDRGLNKYILDYYREKALVTDINFNNTDVNIGLNELINYSNKLLTYSDDPSLLLTINNLIEDKYKNNFRNNIKITSLIGSLIKNENLNIINIVDIYSITNKIKIPYTNIEYAIGENPYLIDEREIINDINIKLPEIKVCPSTSFGNDHIFDENLFLCVPYNNGENYEYSEHHKMFVSQENESVLRSNILYNTPCLIKSSYGYNIYFKKGLTNVSRALADIIFYFPSKKFTFYEAIYTRIHIIIIKKKIKIFLADFINCLVNVNINYDVVSYNIHIETNSDFFEEMFNKLEEFMSLKEIPSADEFNEAYDELNLSVQTNTKFGIDNSLKIMYSLFNKYVPTDQEIYDILNSYLFYPSYNAYEKYINSFFKRNYINIFIYGKVISNAKNGANNNNDNSNSVYNKIDMKDIESSSDNTDSDDPELKKENAHNSTNNTNNTNNLNNTNNTLYVKGNQEVLETQENFGEENGNSDLVQMSFISPGIEYLVNMCESFIRKVTNGVIKKDQSTYYTRKLVNDEDIEINIHNPDQNTTNSITVSYMIESETILSDVLINIIADLISSDFIKFIKIKHNDGYIVNVKTYFTPYGLGGLIFVIESFDKDVENLQADICTFVKYLTFQLLNIEIPELIKKLEIMKEYYIIDNSIFTFNQEYSFILDQLKIGHECFDKKNKIIKIFNELINCPKIIFDKINYILNSSKKTIFKEYKTDNKQNSKNKGKNNENLNEKCNYSYMKNMSNIQLLDNSDLIKKKKLKENEHLISYDTFKNDKFHKKGKSTHLSNFLQVKEKGFFQYVIDYFRNGNKKYLTEGRSLDFKSCEEEMSENKFQVFRNYMNDIKNIREHFLLKFNTDKQINEKCSIDYEEIRKYCYTHDINNIDKENALN